MLTRRALPYWLTAAVIVAAAIVLLALGRVPICTCGYVKLWQGRGEELGELAAPLATGTRPRT